MFELGDKVRDRVSGFVGTACARCVYLYGEPQVCVQAPAADGKIPAAEWFVESRVELML